MKNLVKIILALLAVIILYLLLKNVYILKELMDIVLISYIISFVLKPLQIRVRRLGLNEKKSALVIIFSSTIALILLFLVVFPTMIKESEEFSSSVKQIKTIIMSIQNTFNNLEKDTILLKINRQVYLRSEMFIDTTSNKLLDALVSIGEEALSIFVIPIIVYYFMSDGKKIFNNISIIIPMKKRNIILKIIKDMNNVLSRYVAVQVTLSLIIGMLTFFILFVYKVKFPVLLSLLNAILNIIPYFGPIFGAIPCILMAIMQSPKTALWVAGWLLLLQQFEGNILSPKLTSDKIDIHPLLLIIILVVGGKFGGFIGMVLAVPLCIIFKIVYQNLNYYMY